MHSRQNAAKELLIKDPELRIKEWHLSIRFVHLTGSSDDIDNHSLISLGGQMTVTADMKADHGAASNPATSSSREL